MYHRTYLYIFRTFIYISQKNLPIFWVFYLLYLLIIPSTLNYEPIFKKNIAHLMNSYFFYSMKFWDLLFFLTKIVASYDNLDLHSFEQLLTLNPLYPPKSQISRFKQNIQDRLPGDQRFQEATTSLGLHLGGWMEVIYDLHHGEQGMSDKDSATFLQVVNNHSLTRVKAQWKWLDFNI